MARKVHIVLEDDFDGSVADETVSFALDGVAYEIDLCADNAAAMRDAFAPYVGAARRAGRKAAASAGGRRGGRARSSSPAAPADGPDSAAVRAWAVEQGIEVKQRGRIPADVLRRYDEAHA